MTVTLYELAGADPDLVFSPYCWRTRFALAHKGLDIKRISWRFTQTEALGFSGQGKVPVIVDGERVVHDSWAIAEYLDAAYPERPSLLGGPAGAAHARFINAWTDSVVNAGIGRLVVRDILDVLDPAHQPYFRTSRERAFGMTLEQVVEDRETRVVQWRQQLAPVRNLLRVQPWLGGEAPDYADYILAGTLMWPRCTSRFQLLEADDVVAAWFERVRGLFDGLAARAVRV
jgi:glutathione S-transferase